MFPQWLLKEFPREDGPYTIRVDQDPVTKRDGKMPRRHQAIPRVKLPVCEPCNNELDRRFEKRAKPLIRALLAGDGEVTFTAAEGDIVALWFVKTWLLHAHPSTVHSDPGVTHPKWDGSTVDLWSWTVSNSPPPDGLSMWVTRNDRGNDWDGITQHVRLPTLVVDDLEIVFRVHRLGLRNVEASLVYHPGIQIEHPLEGEGKALRLWPRAGSTPVDLAILPTVHPRSFEWLTAGRLIAHDPHAEAFHLSADLDLHELAQRGWEVRL